jgi:hypothetical protein
VKVLWLSDSGEERQVLSLKTHEQRGIDSFKGHQFLARDAETNKLVSEWTVYNEGDFLVLSPDGCISADGHCGPNWLGVSNDKLNRQREQHNQTRIRQNEDQPKRFPMYTQDGYEKRRLPEDVYDKLYSFYMNNKANHQLEHWSGSSTYVNHWESETRFLPLPDSTKRYIFNQIRPLLEEWSGIKLEGTALYGVRLYTDGSTLQNHVDRPDTHVVSAIMNIAQENMREDWHLHIRNHDGSFRKIAMQPGDMVFYESARCIHGRPEPLHGQHYVNAFIHYKPVDGSEDL